MDQREFEQNICRICFDENVVLNWNNALFEYYGTTYKDCYYKYTQLEYLANDPFSPMLCQNCLNGLQDAHTLILRALESHKYLEELNIQINDVPTTIRSSLRNDLSSTRPKIVNSATTITTESFFFKEELSTTAEHHQINIATANIEENLNYTPTEFETILIDQLEKELPKKQCVKENRKKYVMKPVNTQNFNFKSVNHRNIKSKKLISEKSIKTEEKSNENQIVLKLKFNKSTLSVEASSTKSPEKEKSKRKLTNKTNNHDNNKKLKLPHENKGCLNEMKTTVSENGLLNGQMENTNTQINAADNLPLLLGTFSTKFREKDKPAKQNNILHDDYKKRKEMKNKNAEIEFSNDIPTEHTDTQNEKDYKIEIELLNDKIEHSGRQITSKYKSNERKKEEARMCSICSKILHNKKALQEHEKIHMENRERKETCKVCGLKFYNNASLYVHKQIHIENRKKKHKCEFCDKAFFNKGALNIHRRIHLGQMIPCTLCSKEFFRKIDLEKHMNSHSATMINSNTKKRTKYFVRCKHCDKLIRSTTFKSHTAAHLNVPLMKCSICNKEYFNRTSCVFHMKKIHQKTNEEYNDFIILYTKNRISRLFLEQNAEIQSEDGK